MKIVTYKIKIQYNLRIMKVIPTLSFITLIFLSAGCIRENRSGCGGYLSLKFRYTDSNGAPLTPGFPETDHLFSTGKEYSYVNEKIRLCNSITT